MIPSSFEHHDPLDPGGPSHPHDIAEMPTFNADDPFNPDSLFKPNGEPIEDPAKWEKSARTDKVRTFTGKTLGQLVLEELQVSNLGMFRRKVEGAFRSGSLKTIVTRDEIKKLCQKGVLPLPTASRLAQCEDLNNY